MQTDEALVASIRRGNHDAFDELYRRYSRRLFAYLVRHLGSRADAEDLLQEIFMEVLQDERFELRPGRFGGWLFTVARNRCLTRLRDADRRADRIQEAPPPDPAPSPERGADFELVRRALATLSMPHQDALILKEVGGFTYREIAEIQEVPEGTAKSRLHFAIRAIRSRLAGEGGDS